MKGIQNNMILNGEFFSETKREYNDKTLQCRKSSVEKLEKIGDKLLMMQVKFKVVKLNHL